MKNLLYKESILDLVKASLNLLTILNEKNSEFSIHKEDEISLRKKVLEAMKQSQEINEDFKRNQGRLVGIENLRTSGEHFLKSKDFSSVKDMVDLKLLIEEEEEFIKELLEEKASVEMSIEIITLTLSDFRNLGVLGYIVQILKQENSSIEDISNVIDCFVYIVDIEYSLEYYIISYEVEVVAILNLISFKQHDDLLVKIFYFFYTYYIKSYKLDIFSNFKLNFIQENTEIEEKFFNIFLNTNNEDIKVLICLIFTCLSSITEIYEKIKNLGMVIPTTRYIVKYLKNICKDKLTFENNFKQYCWIINLYYFVCQDKNFKRIGHVEFFKFNTNAVILLFRINHPMHRKELIQMLDKYSIFFDCKMKLLEEKNSILISTIQSRVVNLAKEFISMIEIYIESNKKLAKIKNLLFNLEDEQSVFRDKYSKDVIYYEDTIYDIKKLFLAKLDLIEEMGSLVGILLNFIIMETFADNFAKVFAFKEERQIINFKEGKFGSFYNILITCDELLKNSDFLQKVVFEKDERNFNPEIQKKLFLKMKYLTRYLYQFTILRLITEPLKIIKGNYLHETAFDYSGDINYYLNLIDLFCNDSFTFSKLLFSLYQFFMKVDKFERFYTEENRPYLIKLIDTLGRFLFTDASTPLVNREILRLLCSFLMFSDHTELWIKMERNKGHIDYSNSTDLIIKYKNQNIEYETGYSKRNFMTKTHFNNFYMNNLHKGLLMYTPYKRVGSYFDRMGGIFYSEQLMVLSRNLVLKDSFTISFRFYNPVINTGKFHTLLQSSNGVPIIAITTDRTRIGVFSSNGKWIESGINLDDVEYQNEWIHIVITFKAEHTNSEGETVDNSICFYIEGELDKEIKGKDCALPRDIQFIGNNKEMSEPFGIFCDLRVYNIFFNSKKVKELDSVDAKNSISLFFPKKLVETILTNFLSTTDNSQDSFFFTIRLFNNLLAENIYRKNKNKMIFKAIVSADDINFHNQNIFNKILSYFTTYIPETKKQISKYLKNIT